MASCDMVGCDLNPFDECTDCIPHKGYCVDHLENHTCQRPVTEPARFNSLGLPIEYGPVDALSRLSRQQLTDRLLEEFVANTSSTVRHSLAAPTPSQVHPSQQSICPQIPTPLVTPPTLNGPQHAGQGSVLSRIRAVSSTDKSTSTKRAAGESDAAQPQKPKQNQKRRRKKDCNISPAERASDPEYKRECLIVSAGRLFCEACRHPVQSTKKDRLRQHIDSHKHKEGKKRLQQSQLKDLRIVAALEKLQAESKVCSCPHPDINNDRSTLPCACTGSKLVECF